MLSVFSSFLARMIRAGGLFVLAALAAGILSACGGGGGGGGGSSGPVNPPPVTPPPVTPPIATDIGVSVVAQNTDCASGSACGGRADGIRQDPEFRNAGSGHSPLERINAHYAHARGFTGRGVTVAVADHGVDLDHPEFAGRLTPGYNAVLNPFEPDTPDDRDGHGTGVAGIIAAAKSSSTDGANMHGVAYESVIVPVRVLHGTFRVDIGGAFRHAFDNAFVVNNSWGYETTGEFDLPGYGRVRAPRPETQARIPSILPGLFREAIGKDRVIVFAAGNEGWNSETGVIARSTGPDRSVCDDPVEVINPAPGSGYSAGQRICNIRIGRNLSGELGLQPLRNPGLQGHWLHVAAVDQNGRIASFSNGCGAAKQWCLVAPGILIQTANNDGGRQIQHGTSAAAPFVSGAAAVLKSAFPNLGAKQVVTLLLITARDLGAPGVDDVYGHGLLDLEKATRPQTDPSCGRDGYQCPGLRLAAARGGAGDGLEISDFDFADLSASRIAPSPAFGDAFSRTRAAAGFVDGFDRAYRARLSALAGPSAGFRGDAAKIMRNGAPRERALADGFFTRQTGDGAAVEFGWRGGVGAWRAALAESRNWRSGGGGMSDAAFALGAARWRGAEIGVRDGLRFGFRAAEFAGSDSVMRQWFARRAFGESGWSALPEMGVLDERNSILGAGFSGGFASGRARTFYGKLSGAAELGAGLRGFAGALYARTTTGAPGGAAVSRFSDLASGGWELGLGGERWRFSVWRPAGVLSGEMRIPGVSGYDENGKYRAVESRVDLSARHPHRLTFAAGGADGDVWWSAEKDLGGAARFSVSGAKIF